MSGVSYASGVSYSYSELRKLRNLTTSTELNQSRVVLGKMNFQARTLRMVGIHGTCFVTETSKHRIL